MVIRRRHLALVIVLAFGFVLCGCDSIDPTSQFFGVAFTNDTQVPINLKLCADSGCKHFHYSVGWKPGQSARENVSDRDVLTRWLVQNASTKETLGCLPLEFDQKYADVRVRISQAVPCPGAVPLTVERGRGEGQS